jgi:hypothetical protein
MVWRGEGNLLWGDKQNRELRRHKESKAGQESAWSSSYSTTLVLGACSSTPTSFREPRQAVLDATAPLP